MPGPGTQPVNIGGAQSLGPLLPLGRLLSRLGTPSPLCLGECGHCPLPTCCPCAWARSPPVPRVAAAPLLGLTWSWVSPTSRWVKHSGRRDPRSPQASGPEAQHTPGLCYECESARAVASPSPLARWQLRPTCASQTQCPPSADFWGNVVQEENRRHLWLADKSVDYFY